MRRKQPPRNFGFGEVAPWFDGLPGFENALKTAENFIIRPGGSAVRRPGTYYAGTIKTHTTITATDRPVLVGVEIDSANRFVLELGDAYVRFWNAGTHAVVGGVGSEYEVTTPWSLAEVADLRSAYIPSEKSIYWVHPKHAMRKLAFTSAASWELSIVDAWTQPPWVLFHDTHKAGVLVDGFYNDPIDITGSIHPGKDLIIQALDYNGSVYVALAQNTTDSTYELLVSNDGQNWVVVDDAVPYTAHVTLPNRGIAHSKSGNLIVTLNSTTLYASEDNGLTWVSVTTTSGTTWDVVNYSADNGSWRILGGETAGFFCKYSEDGYTWASVTMPAGGFGTVTTVFKDLLAENNLWVAITGGSTADQILVASAGLVTQTFQQRLAGSGTMRAIAYGEPEGQPYWIVSQSTTIWGSADALTWTQVGNPAVAMTHLLWTGNRFIGLVQGTSGTTWYTSDDKGATWTKHNDAPWGTQRFHFLDRVTGAENPMDQPVFGLSGTFPSVITAHEGRLIIGGSINKPGTLWGSKAGDFQNFYLGETAERAFEYELLGPRSVDIQWIIGGNDLVVGTHSAEGVLRGEQGIGITPNAAAFRWQSSFGSKNLQPVRVGDHVIFAQRGGEIVRGFLPTADAWRSPELTALAKHITDGGVLEIDVQEDPHQMLWFVRSDGRLLSCTFDGERPAWATHPTYQTYNGGTRTETQWRSVALIPTNSNTDELWAIVYRGDGTNHVNFVEYMDPIDVASKEDAHYVDAGREATDSVTISTITTLTHLAGYLVDVLVGGNEISTGVTVSASGTINVAPLSATHLHAGIGYDSYLQTLRMPETGRKRVEGNLYVWVRGSIGGAYGPTQSNTEATAYSSLTELTTDMLEVAFPGQYDGDGYIWVVQSEPLPIEIVALAFDAQIGDR